MAQLGLPSSSPDCGEQTAGFHPNEDTVSQDFRTPPSTELRKEGPLPVRLFFAAGALVVVLWLAVLVYLWRELWARAFN
jgi:hypothetical protein